MKHFQTAFIMYFILLQKVNHLDLNNHDTGLSINILCTANKSPVQRGFFENSTGDLLPTLRFLGGLYNFCNFVIIFSLL